MPTDMGVLRFVALRPPEGNTAFQAKVMSYDGPSELKDPPKAGGARPNTGGIQPNQPKQAKQPKRLTIDEKAERHLNSNRYFFRKFPGAELVSGAVASEAEGLSREDSAADLRDSVNTRLQRFLGGQAGPGNQPFDDAVSSAWTSYWAHAISPTEGPSFLGQLVVWLRMLHLASLSDQVAKGLKVADWFALRPSLSAELFTDQAPAADNSIRVAQQAETALATRKANLKTKIAALEAGERSVRKILGRKGQATQRTVPPPPGGRVVAPPRPAGPQAGPAALPRRVAFGFPDPMILAAADLDAAARALTNYGLQPTGAYGPDLLEQIADELRKAYSELIDDQATTSTVGGLAAFTRSRLRWDGGAQ